LASEAKDTTGIEGASDAQVSKGKEPTVSETAVVGITAATTPKRKRADKEKTEKVVEEKKKITKKPRTRKKRAPKVV
ncbi:hypothetical protein A2U01_0074148, partial [Trifolium medium]|nr:hypothetical protein [Trifolium medium]